MGIDSRRTLLKSALLLPLAAVFGSRVRLPFRKVQDFTQLKRIPVPQGTPSSETGLLTNHTFENFVVGRNNEFAHAACLQVAEMPGRRDYSPLFVCAPNGMGKTHLLHAFGNKVVQKNPRAKVRYISAERFLYECISSIRKNEMEKFREKFRESCDVLLMDDVSILGRGEAVQEEFFHTLNHFSDHGKQVVVACETFPKMIRGLESRIRSRFDGGLIADIEMPDIERYSAILKSRASHKKHDLPDDVASYVARKSAGSIRELVGNMNRVQMYSELQKRPVTLQMAKYVLST